MCMHVCTCVYVCMCVCVYVCTVGVMEKLPLPLYRLTVEKMVNGVLFAARRSNVECARRLSVLH